MTIKIELGPTCRKCDGKGHYCVEIPLQGSPPDNRRNCEICGGCGYERIKKNTRLMTPQDTENKIHLESISIESIQDIIDACKEKWGDVDLKNMLIEHDHIQVKCFGYDQYDGSDYIDYFVISKAI